MLNNNLIKLIIASMIFTVMQASAEELVVNQKIEHVIESPINTISNDYTPNMQGIDKKYIKVNGSNHPYYLYIPKKIKASGPHPLIILLHGAQRNGASLVDKWRDIAEEYGVILVGPDAFSAGWQISSAENDLVKNVANDVMKTYNIDKKHIYLFGHSSGARFAIYLAKEDSDYFAAVALHAGMLVKPEDSNYLKNPQRKIPIEMYVGDRDPIFPLAEVKQTAYAFDSYGYPIKLYIIKNHDHWYYDMAPFINSKVWNFFQKHSLEK